MLKSFFTALGNLFKKPATVKYPFEQTYKAKGYRGLIKYDESLCIFCRKCEMVCPPGAIVFSQTMDGKQTYHYNPYVCIYCGECVRSCPKAGAILQSEDACPPALKEADVSKSWFKTVKDAKDSRAAFMAEKKRLQEIAAAAAKQENPTP